MTQFENADFAEREKELGDTAESKFEEWANKNGVLFVRTGFNRPPFKRFFRFHEYIRLFPDYACEGNDVALIEVKGCGKEGLKIKQQSVDALLYWNVLNTVKIFVWNSSLQQYALLSLGDLLDRLRGKQVYSFPDGKTYRIIRNDEIEWEYI